MSEVGSALTPNEEVQGYEITQTRVSRVSQGPLTQRNPGGSWEKEEVGSTAWVTTFVWARSLGRRETVWHSRDLGPGAGLLLVRGGAPPSGLACCPGSGPAGSWARGHLLQYPGELPYSPTACLSLKTRLREPTGALPRPGFPPRCPGLGWHCSALPRAWTPWWL